MDFPVAVPVLPVISVWSIYAIGPSGRASGASGSASGAWPSANRALAVPFVLPGHYLVRALWWLNGTTANGNVDCGIYSESGALLTSAGSTAQTGTSVIQSVTLGTPLLLTAGKYNMALALSSGTGTIERTNTVTSTKVSGVTQMASAFPLPATFTMATAAVDYIPLFGIASRTLI